jgi:membrane protein implicated in regulation of membrane protease activity
MCWKKHQDERGRQMESYEFVIKPNKREAIILSIKKLFTSVSVQVVYIFLSLVLGLLAFMTTAEDKLIYLALYIVICYFSIYAFAILLVLVKIAARKKNKPKVIVYEKSRINRDGYTEYTANGVNHVKWTEFYRALVDKRFYRLYISVNSRYILIPKRNLTPEANEFMRSVISDNELLIKKPKRQLSSDDGAGSPVAQVNYPNAVNVVLRTGDAMLYGLYDLYRNHIFLIIVYILILLDVLFSIVSGFAVTDAVLPAAFLIFLNMLMILPIYIRCRAYNKHPSTVSYFLNETEFCCKTKFGETKIEWARLYKAVGTKNYFYFYISKRMAFILPKRYIAPENIVALGMLIQGYRLNKTPSRR